MKEKWGVVLKKGHRKKLGKSSKKSLSIQKKRRQKILGYETKTSKLRSAPGGRPPSYATDRAQ